MVRGDGELVSTGIEVAVIAGVVLCGFRVVVLTLRRYLHERSR
jgi:hypothetical protein